MVALLMSQIRSGGGRQADRSGAIEAVAKAPFGGWLLAATAAGLGAFAVFRVWAAIKGDEEKPFRRAGWIGSALVYSYLAVLAIGVLLSEDDSKGGGGGGEEGQALTARVLGWPLGPWLVGAAGL